MTTWPDIAGSSAPRAAWTLTQPHINAQARGVKVNDPTFNNTTVIQACIDELTPPGGTAGGGTVVLPAGSIWLASTITLANNIRVVGQGKRVTSLKAFRTADGSPTTFTAATPVVRLGQPTQPVEFAMRVEHLGVDTRALANVDGVYSRNANEGSGCFHVIIDNHQNYGIFFDRCSIVGCEEIEMITTSSTALAGFYGYGSAGYNFFRNATIINLYTTPLSGDGILIDGNQYDVYGIHGSGWTNLIRTAGNSPGTIENIHGHIDNTNIIRLGSGSSQWVVKNVYPQNPNGIVDDLNGTVGDTYINLYAQGELKVGNFRFGSTTHSIGEHATSGEQLSKVVFNNQTYTRGPAGWVVTASGSPDTWKPFGAIVDVGTITYSASMTPNWWQAVQRITVTNGTNMTINTPSNPTGDAIPLGWQITLDIKNSSGGAMGVITWGTGTQFLLAGAFTNPANTKRRTITFYYDGTSWVEMSRAAADI